MSENEDETEASPYRNADRLKLAAFLSGAQSAVRRVKDFVSTTPTTTPASLVSSTPIKPSVVLAQNAQLSLTDLISSSSAITKPSLPEQTEFWPGVTAEREASRVRKKQRSQERFFDGIAAQVRMRTQNLAYRQKPSRNPK